MCYKQQIQLNYVMMLTYILWEQLTVCTQCDSMVYDGNSYSWVLMNMGNPTGIKELTVDQINDGKMYDLLGREVTKSTYRTNVH